MRTRTKLIGIGTVIGLIVGVYLFFYAIGPIMLAGEPTPVYIIRNKDTEYHQVTIEIFDLDGKQVLNKTYELEPRERVEYDRGFGWHPTVTWYFYTWSEGKYNFEITVDKEITETDTIVMHPMKTMDMNLICEGQENKTCTIRIGIVVV